MTPNEIDALQIVLNNEQAMKGLQKTFYIAAAQLMPEIKEQDDEVIGQGYRAHDTAKKIIDAAFTTLESYNKSQKDSNVDDRHL